MSDLDVTPEGQSVPIDDALLKARKPRGNCAACTDDIVAGDKYGLLKDRTKRILCETCWTAAEWHNRQLAESGDGVVRTFNNEPVTASEMEERLVVKPDAEGEGKVEAILAEVTEGMTERAEAKSAPPTIDPLVAAFLNAGLLADAPDDQVEAAADVARQEYTSPGSREFCPGCQGRGWLGEFSNSCPACSGTGKRRDEHHGAPTDPNEAPEVEVVDQVAARPPTGSVWDDPERSALAVKRRQEAATAGLLERRRKAAAAHVEDADVFGYATPEAAPKRTWTDPETGYTYTQQSANRWTGLDNAGLDLEAITGDEIVRREAAVARAVEAGSIKLGDVLSSPRALSGPLPPLEDPWLGLNPELEYVDPSGNSWRAIAVGQWLYVDPSGTEWRMNSRDLRELVDRAIVDAERPKPKLPLPPPPPAPLPASTRLPLPPPPPVRASLPLPPPAPAALVLPPRDRVRELLEAAINVAPVEVGMSHEDLLDALAPYQGTDPKVALREARGILEAAIVNHPRSQQKTIGPSELGTECEHCLAAKLAGWEQKSDIAWLPTVGTAVHSWIERSILDLQEGKPSSQRRYLTEARVVVGQVDGDDVEGSTDLVDLVAGLTVDWKVVGKTTLTKARSGPSRVYRAQQHLYARGWNKAGVKVDNVAIAYLPRNELSLASAIWWHEPYDEAFADEVLANATAVRRRIRALETIGDEAVDAWITSLPRAKGCRDCERYADAPKPSRPDYTPGDSLAGIIS